MPGKRRRLRPKGTSARTVVRSRTALRARRRRAVARSEPIRPAVVPDLDELAETLNIMLPELAARLAALEHLLVEKGLCGRDELASARSFVDPRRGTE